MLCFQNTGSTFKGINSGLITYFFGENKEGVLTVERFLEFQRQLQNEILRLEFNRKSTGTSNTVSEKAFAELIIGELYENLSAIPVPKCSDQGTMVRNNSVPLPKLIMKKCFIGAMQC